MTRKARFRFPKFQTVGSISAMVVAVASLFVAWDEANSVRRQQAAAVLPIIKIATPFMNDASDRSFRINVSNVGVGPAFIDKADIRWNGQSLQSIEALRPLIADTAGDAAFWTSRLEGQILGGGETLLMFEVDWDPVRDGAARAAASTATSVWDDLTITACYCSVYDRCWVTEMNRTGRPDRVDSCDKP
ncbi:hypothetical protein [uncultured Algimonas sp.]|uniref:hypothetical protein n=1 Tax=uncultured Algimonas sp. TaxID=1547920 RepID=UPI00260E0C5C|nr:hypothetical protein [uncultured Algimonas sp.]